MWPKLLLIATVALLVRLAAVAAPGLPAPLPWEDIAIARNLAIGNGYCHHRYYGPTAVKAPAYPLLLTPLAVVSTPSRYETHLLRRTGILNAGLGAIATLLVGLLGTRRFGSRVGVTAAVLLTLHPSVVYMARIAESTNLSIPLVTAAVLAIDRARGRPERRPFIVAGLLIGLAALSNPMALPCLSLAALIWHHQARRGLFALTLATVVVLAPWTLRNYAAFGRLVPIKSPLWLDIYAGLQPEHLAGRLVLPADLTERIEQRSFGLRELERERVYAQELTPWMVANRGLVGELAVWRVGQLWGLYGQRDRPNQTLDLTLRLGPEIALLFLTLAAIPIAWRIDRPTAIVLLAFLATYTAVYAAIVAINTRYHLEVVWAQILLASLSVDRLRMAFDRWLRVSR